MKLHSFLILALILIAGCATPGPHFDLAREQDTVQAYEAFLKEYPRSEYSPKVQLRINEIKREQFLKKEQSAKEEWQLWNRVVDLRTIGGYEVFISKYPNGSNSKIAKEMIEKLGVAKKSGYFFRNKKKPLNSMAVLLTNTLNGRVYIEGINSRSSGIKYGEYRWIYLPPGNHTIDASFSGSNVEIKEKNSPFGPVTSMRSQEYRSFLMPIKGKFVKGQVYFLDHRAVKIKDERFSPPLSKRERFRERIGEILPEIKENGSVYANKKYAGTDIDGVMYYPDEWEQLR